MVTVPSCGFIFDPRQFTVQRGEAKGLACYYCRAVRFTFMGKTVLPLQTIRNPTQRKTRACESPLPTPVHVREIWADFAQKQLRAALLAGAGKQAVVGTGRLQAALTAAVAQQWPAGTGSSMSDCKYNCIVWQSLD